jgi:hypothetical protein
LFVLFLLAIVLSDLLFMASDYPFDIFKLLNSDNQHFHQYMCTLSVKNKIFAPTGKQQEHLPKARFSTYFKSSDCIWILDFATLCIAHCKYVINICFVKRYIFLNFSSFTSTPISKHLISKDVDSVKRSLLDRYSPTKPQGT